jgi:Putative DNA-binding domain
VASSDLDHLDVATLDAAAVAALIAAGETVVERKETVPSDGLGASVAAYANSGGGWILLGVSNSGDSAGWTPPGRSEVHDWLRNHLRDAIDPLPDFNCKSVEYAGKPIVALRIHPGAPPYVLRKNGSVYIREPGGKHPIRSQAQLLDLVHQSTENETKAEERLRGSSLIRDSILGLAPADASPDQTRLAEWMLVTTPLAMPVDFATRALSRSTVDAAIARLARRLEGIALPPRHAGWPRPLDTGFVLDGHSDISRLGVRLLVDAGGTVGARLTERLTRGVLHTGEMADHRIAPLLDLAFGTLTDIGASGRGLLRLHLRVTATAPGWKPVITLSSADRTAELDAGAEFQVGDETGLPSTTDSLSETAERIMRAIARRAQVPYWEP